MARTGVAALVALIAGCGGGDYQPPPLYPTAAPTEQAATPPPPARPQEADRQEVPRQEVPRQDEAASPAALICAAAAEAYAIADRDSGISGVAGHVAYIRDVNERVADGSGLYWAVWNLADAWDNALELSGDPEVGPAANGNVFTMLGNLVAQCGPPA
jgi:hypothetical protein